MTQYDMSITGGTLVSATGRVRADMAISEGRIAAVVAPGTPLDAAETIDATGRHLLFACPHG